MRINLEWVKNLKECCCLTNEALTRKKERERKWGVFSKGESFLIQLSIANVNVCEMICECAVQWQWLYVWHSKSFRLNLLDSLDCEREGDKWVTVFQFCIPFDSRKLQYNCIKNSTKSNLLELHHTDFCFRVVYSTVPFQNSLVIILCFSCTAVNCVSSISVNVNFLF